MAALLADALACHVPVLSCSNAYVSSREKSGTCGPLHSAVATSASSRWSDAAQTSTVLGRRPGCSLKAGVEMHTALRKNGRGRHTHERQRGDARKMGARACAGVADEVARADIADSGVAALNEQFAIDDSVSVEVGEGGLPKVVLKHRSGSAAEVYLLGACVTKWVAPNGQDLLYVRPDAVFTGAKPISGGIPHCFPQFGPGEMQQHGFARNLTWRIGSTSADVNPDEPEPTVELILEDSDYTRSMWDASFKVVYMVSLKPDQLVTNFRVMNSGENPFEFTAALHTYFRAVSSEASVKGLKGCKFLDKDPDPIHPTPGIEERLLVTFPGFVDRMYIDVADEVVLETGLGKPIAIQSKGGWKDAVVWNPHLTMENCYKEFVCVENAHLDKVVLQPGDTWHAEMKLTPL